MDGFAELVVGRRMRADPLAGSDEKKEKRAESRAFFIGPKTKPRGYAACLCMAPDADAVPRIALIERSIAPHRRAISAAARPSA